MWWISITLLKRHKTNLKSNCRLSLTNFTHDTTRRQFACSQLKLALFNWLCINIVFSKHIFLTIYSNNLTPVIQWPDALPRPAVYFAIFNNNHSLFNSRYSFDQPVKEGSLSQACLLRDSNPDLLHESGDSNHSATQTDSYIPCYFIRNEGSVRVGIKLKLADLQMIAQHDSRTCPSE